MWNTMLMLMINMQALPRLIAQKKLVRTACTSVAPVPEGGPSAPWGRGGSPSGVRPISSGVSRVIATVTSPIASSAKPQMIIATRQPSSSMATAVIGRRRAPAPWPTLSSDNDRALLRSNQLLRTGASELSTA
jgi:hypothetical protein